ncbi:MAG: RecX family transcriptional regulator [Clostridia bacterium]|nr:RecX family transcriptional regulator [Clostridia bacterium]
MAVITKIEQQVKNKDRVSIYLDGEFKLGCSMDLVVLNHLKEGAQVTEDQLENLVFENEKSMALNKAVTLLGKNLKTKKQMRDYLKGKGYIPQIINYVLDKLCEYNYINDINYATIYVRSVKHKYGKIKIVNELKMKGVSEKDIDFVMQEFETDAEDIMALANKYLKNKEITTEILSKMYRFLLSKGFEYDDVSAVIKSFKEN